MTKLHHIRQLAAKKESSPGTEITTHGVADLVRVRELTLEVAPQYFERPVHTRSFGYTPRINGNSSATVSFAVELAGHSGNSGSFALLNVPTWGRLLQACGFAQSPVYFVTVPLGGLSGGPIQHGELLDDASTATGTAVGTWEDDSPAIEVPVRDITGGPYTGTVTGQTSGASFTAGANKGGTLSGFGWYPDTDSTDTVTLRLYNDGDLIIVYGARGDVTIDCQSQDIALLRFTFQGIYKSTAAASMLNDTLTGAYPEHVPPTFVGTNALSLWDGTTDYEPPFTNLQFTMGNNVVMRQNSNSATGWSTAHLSNRTPNGTINPDDEGASTFDWRDNIVANTRYQLDSVWGSTVGNKFHLQAPAIEFDNVGDGERDEVETIDMNFRCTRGFESGADQNGVGDDNELIIFNF